MNEATSAVLTVSQPLKSLSLLMGVSGGLGLSATGEADFEFFAELLGGESLLEASALGDADRAGLFAHGDNKDIAFLGYANSCAVARAEGRVGHFIRLGEGQLDAGGDDLCALDDHREVVESGAWEEDGLEESRGDASMDGCAALDEAAKGGIALEDDEATETSLAEKRAGLTDGGGDFLYTADVAAAEDGRFAEADQAAAEFGLEDDDERDGQQGQEVLIEELESLEGLCLSEDADEQCGHNDQEERSLERAGRASALDEADDNECDDPDDGQLEQDLPGGIGRQSFKQSLGPFEEHRRSVPVPLGCAGVVRRVYPTSVQRTRSVLFSRVPYKVVRFQPTPNPNALKCILDAAVPEPIRSYRGAAEAAGDPLGRGLFEVSGVTGLLISGDWIAVNKAANADWETIKAGVQGVLAKA